MQSIKLAATRDLDAFQVWAMLDDKDFNGNPVERGESFVIGEGATLGAALEDAKQELERAVGVIATIQSDPSLWDKIVVLRAGETQADFYPQSRYGSKL